MTVIYISKDGQKFYSESECKQHELYLEYKETFPWIEMKRHEFNAVVEFIKDRV